MYHLGVYIKTRTKKHVQNTHQAGDYDPPRGGISVIDRAGFGLGLMPDPNRSYRSMLCLQPAKNKTTPKEDTPCQFGEIPPRVHRGVLGSQMAIPALTVNYFQISLF